MAETSAIFLLRKGGYPIAQEKPRIIENGHKNFSFSIFNAICVANFSTFAMDNARQMWYNMKTDFNYVEIRRYVYVQYIQGEFREKPL